MSTLDQAMRRRLALTIGLLVVTPWASAQSAAATRTVGVFSLLGDGLQLAYPLEATDTRIERTVRETLETKDIGFDQLALRAVREAFARAEPRTRLALYRAVAPLTPAEQRAVADGAARAELPDWIVQAINGARLSHVLLITRHRGDAAFPVAEGHTVGSGTLEGIGFYVDKMTTVKNLDTGLDTRGFLGAYTMLRLQLMDTLSGDIVGQRDVAVGRLFQGRNDAEIANIWLALDGREKVEVLREMVQSNVARVMPALLAGK